MDYAMRFKTGRNLKLYRWYTYAEAIAQFKALKVKMKSTSGPSKKGAFYIAFF
jgi:hypothetical protein